MAKSFSKPAPGRWSHSMAIPTEKGPHELQVWLASIAQASMRSKKLVTLTLPDDVYVETHQPLLTANSLTSEQFQVYTVEFFNPQEGYGFVHDAAGNKAQIHASRFEVPKLKLVLPTYEQQAQLAVIGTKPDHIQEVRKRDSRTILRANIPPIHPGQMVVGMAEERNQSPSRSSSQSRTGGKFFLQRWMFQEQYMAATQEYQYALSHSGTLFAPYTVGLRELKETHAHDSPRDTPNLDAEFKDRAIFRTTMFLSAIHVWRALVPFLGKNQSLWLLPSGERIGTDFLTTKEQIEHLIQEYDPCQLKHLNPLVLPTIPLTRLGMAVGSETTPATATPKT